jgi:hypothetical protein
VRLIAIGWLEQGFEYTKGRVGPGFLEKLRELLNDPWGFVYFAGFHECDFCVPVRRRHTALGPHGYRNLFVPGDKVIYAAPELITHYIDAHEYCPPQVFQNAVRRCPQMSSRAYFRTMKSGWAEFSPFKYGAS